MLFIIVYLPPLSCGRCDYRNSNQIQRICVPCQHKVTIFVSNYSSLLPRFSQGDQGNREIEAPEAKRPVKKSRTVVSASVFCTTVVLLYVFIKKYTFIMITPTLLNFPKFQISNFKFRGTQDAWQSLKRRNDSWQNGSLQRTLGLDCGMQ